VAGLFFLRFWWRTRDSLFACFAAAFGIFAGQRLGLALTAERNEDDTLFYAVRLLAFLLILAGIWQKNRQARPKA
jgi:hypothetical protein